MGTKRKSPPDLAELCHDALADGVLAKHDGLPESWLAMFKAHPAAWAQLQTAVLAPDKRYLSGGRELTEESTVFISSFDSGMMRTNTTEKSTCGASDAPAQVAVHSAPNAP